MKLILELSLNEPAKGTLFNRFDLKIVEGEVTPRGDFSREEVDMVEKALKSSGLNLFINDTRKSTNNQEQHKDVFMKLEQLEKMINVMELIYNDKDVSRIENDLIQSGKTDIEQIFLHDTVFFMELNKEYYSNDERKLLLTKLTPLNDFERVNQVVDSLLKESRNMKFHKKQAEIHLRYTDLKRRIERDNHKKLTEQMRTKLDAVADS